MQRIKASVDEEIEHLMILEKSSEVRALERGRGAFDQSVKDMPERRVELASKRSELETSLANLGTDWDTGRLDEFDLSLVVREEVANHGERLQSARATVDRSQTALAQEEATLTDALEATQRAQSEHDAATPPELDENDIRERRRPIRQCRTTLDELGRAEDRSRDLRAQIDDGPEPGAVGPQVGRSRLLAGVVGALGVVLLLAGLWLVATTTLGASAFLAVIGAVLTTVAVFWFMRSRADGQPTASPATSRVQAQISDANEQLAGIRSRLQAGADALGLDALNSDTLLEAEEGLDAADARLREWRQLETTLAQATERAERQTQRRDGAQQALTNAQEALEAEQQAWQSWLQQRGLRSTFSPDGIQELRTLVDLARTHYRDVVEMQIRIAAIQTDIDEFIDLARPLADAYGFEAEWSDYPGVAGVADDIIDLHREVSEAARTRADAEKELDSAQQDLEARQKGQQVVADQIGALLKSGEAEDADDFRQRDRVFQERAGLNSTISNALEQMQRMSGPGDALEALRTTLSKTDLQTIRDDVRQCEALLEEIDGQRSELDTERGAIRTTLGRAGRRGGFIAAAAGTASAGGGVAGARAGLGSAYDCREPDPAGAEQVREGAAAGRDPPRRALLPRRHRRRVPGRVFPTGQFRDQRQGRRGQHQNASAAQPGHPRAAVPGPALRADSGNGPAFGAPAGHSGRSVGQLRPDQGHQGRRLIHRTIRNEPSTGLHLPPADRGLVCGRGGSAWGRWGGGGSRFENSNAHVDTSRLDLCAQSIYLFRQ